MIRRAALDDGRALAEVETRCFATGAWSLATLQAEITADIRSVLLATGRDSVIGYGSIQVIDDVADLHRIAVVPAAQRGGVGRQLLVELLAVASTRGAARTLLEVAAHNAPAIALYQSFGYSQIARRAGYYADGSDALVMERLLA